MSFLTLIFAPYGLIWLGTRNRWRVHRWLSFGAVLLIQLLSIIPAGAVAYAVYIQNQASLPTAAHGIYTNYRITQAALHGLPGWEGVDVSAGCGEPIYTPFSGIVTFRGLDGYRHFENGRLYNENTMLTVKGDNGMTITYLHGNYNIGAGERVAAGQIIGREASNGWSTGCHSHVILKDENGRLLNYLDWQNSSKGGKPLKISWYDPLLGGVNCDHDCTTMTTGVKVTPDRYGRTAACIREWTGRTVFIPELGTFECLDRGGAIVERDGYIWIDLLLHEPLVPFGTLVYEYEVR